MKKTYLIMRLLILIVSGILLSGCANLWSKKSTVYNYLHNNEGSLVYGRIKIFDYKRRHGVRIGDPIRYYDCHIQTGYKTPQKELVGFKIGSYHRRTISDEGLFSIVLEAGKYPNIGIRCTNIISGESIQNLINYNLSTYFPINIPDEKVQYYLGDFSIYIKDTTSLKKSGWNTKKGKFIPQIEFQDNFDSTTELFKKEMEGYYTSYPIKKALVAKPSIY